MISRLTRIFHSGLLDILSFKLNDLEISRLFLDESTNVRDIIAHPSIAFAMHMPLARQKGCTTRYGEGHDACV